MKPNYSQDPCFTGHLYPKVINEVLNLEDSIYDFPTVQNAVVVAVNRLADWLESTFSSAQDLKNWFESAGTHIGLDRINIEEINDGETSLEYLENNVHDFYYLLAQDVVGGGVGLWELFDIQHDFPSLNTLV